MGLGLGGVMKGDDSMAAVSGAVAGWEETRPESMEVKNSETRPSLEAEADSSDSAESSEAVVTLERRAAKRSRWYKRMGEKAARSRSTTVWTALTYLRARLGKPRSVRRPAYC